VVQVFALPVVWVSWNLDEEKGSSVQTYNNY